MKKIKRKLKRTRGRGTKGGEGKRMEKRRRNMESLREHKEGKKRRELERREGWNGKKAGFGVQGGEEKRKAGKGGS